MNTVLQAIYAEGVKNPLCKQAESLLLVKSSLTVNTKDESIFLIIPKLSKELEVLKPLNSRRNEFEGHLSLEYSQNAFQFYFACNIMPNHTEKTVFGGICMRKTLQKKNCDPCKMQKQ